VCLIFNPQMSKLPCNIAQEHILPEMWYIWNNRRTNFAWNRL